MLDYLTSIPGGTPQTAAQFLMRLNDIASGAEGSQRSEAFWQSLFDQGLQQAIQGCQLACETIDLEAVYEILASSPSEFPDEAARSLWIDSSACSLMLRVAEARAGANDRRFRRVRDFLLNEVGTIGPKARGALLSMNNGLLGKFLASPFYEAFCDRTTITPEEICKRRLIVALAADIHTFGLPGRMHALAWIMMMQGYALRRDAATGNRIVICRDECANFTHPGYDAMVAAQSRSQKCLHLDLFQDFDLMESTYGGGPKAKNESLSGWSNHGIKIMFKQENPDSAEIQSRLIGDEEQVQIGGSCGQGQPSDWMGKALGVKPNNTSFHMHWQRRVRPEHFARLGVGQCVMVANGDVHFLDLYRRK